MSLKQQLIGQQLAESDAAQRMIGTYVQIERQQLATAVELAEAAGIEVDADLPDPDARASALLDLSQAVVSDSWESWWCEEVGRSWGSTPPAEWVGIGTDAEAWAEQIETWADQVRDQYPDIEANDRELASIAADEVYGVGLGRIEEEIIEIDPAEETNRLVTGNFRAAQHLMDQVRERIEQGDHGDGDDDS